MLRRIEIGNYKSIAKLPIELGRFNVFIGENGAGKSNILEAIALASAAANDKLDNEFLAARGVRVTRPELMRAGFTSATQGEPIAFSATHESGEQVDFELHNDNQPYSKWQIRVAQNVATNDTAYFKSAFRDLMDRGAQSAEGKARFLEEIGRALDTLGVAGAPKAARKPARHRPGPRAGKAGHDGDEDRIQAALMDLVLMSALQDSFLTGPFRDFLIYSPENSALRTFDRDGQIEPLGVNGEGLLKLIHVHATMADSTVLDDIRAALGILGWFEDFSPSTELADERLIIRDRYLGELPFDLDQKSANEGFLFLLFYFALFTSKLTPRFFAIDNIDASLNPRLCRELTGELVRLSRANDKQVLVTTHNPAVLDGLDLDDDEQRLFVVSRGRDGATRLKRIARPAADGALSELFLRGLLGGLPKGF